ncbi:uncharacterized protein [Macaca fascicularis]|uniref:uncharacterized protein n=1 Tax=Macaca fascicularis TaxID=9541 RepID=UPI003D15942A
MDWRAAVAREALGPLLCGCALALPGGCCTPERACRKSARSWTASGASTPTSPTTDAGASRSRGTGDRCGRRGLRAGPGGARKPGGGNGEFYCLDLRQIIRGGHRCPLFHAGFITCQPKATPSVTLFPPSSEELQANKATLVCHKSDLYPGILMVTWKADGTPITQGMEMTTPSKQQEVRGQQLPEPDSRAVEVPQKLQLPGHT